VLFAKIKAAFQRHETPLQEIKTAFRSDEVVFGQNHYFFCKNKLKNEQNRVKKGHFYPVF
jgi:hypothetical protein